MLILQIFLIFVFLFTAFLLIIREISYFDINPIIIAISYTLSGLLLIILIFYLHEKKDIIIALQDEILANKKLKPDLDTCAYCTKLQNQKIIKELRQKIIENNKLISLLPICAKCHKIRDDAGYWNRLEDFLKRNNHINFSHGYCPICTEELLKDISL